MKPRLISALAVSLGAWIGALTWLYGGVPPWEAWKTFGLPMIAFCLVAGLRSLGRPKPVWVREAVLLGVLAVLLAAAWCVDLGLIPALAAAHKTGLEGLRLWPCQLVLFALTGLLLGGAFSSDLRLSKAVIPVLAVAGIAWGGAAFLRQVQELAPADLSRLFLDRRANASGDRPRSNIRIQSGAYRAVTLEGVLANENPFPVWGVELVLHLDGTDPVHLIIPGDIPAHGTAPLFWAGRFKVEDLPRLPSWELKVCRARRHWGGGPSLTAQEEAIQSPAS